MLKWNISTHEEEPVRMPGLFSWIAVAVYVGAFTFVIFTWIRWLLLLSQHSQSLVLWGL